MAETEVIPQNSPLYKAPEGTPVVETPAEPIIPAEPGTPPAEPGTPPAEPAKPYEFAYKPVWERLEKDGIAIPDDFKKGKFPEGKDEYQAFVDLVLENTEFEPENQTATDPFIENYLQVPPEKRDEYIQQYQNAQAFFQLDPEAGLKAWYQAQTVTKDGKEERKYDDAAIDKHLETLSPIQKEEQWNGVKGLAQKQFDDVYKKGTEQQDQRHSAYTGRWGAFSMRHSLPRPYQLEGELEIHLSGGALRGGGHDRLPLRLSRVRGERGKHRGDDPHHKDGEP